MTKADREATRRRIAEETRVLREVLSSLVPMDWDQKLRLLRWVCERNGIDPTRLTL